MKAIGLVVVFVTAKLAVLYGHPIEWSAWTAIVYFWQDVLVGLLFAGADTLLGMISVSTRARWSLYWAIVVYVVLNIPVERALYTPLTWPMIRAARGPLTDSLLHDATPLNLLLMTFILIIGVLPSLFGSVRRRIPSWLLLAGCPIVLAGPCAAARTETLGVSGNVVAALLTSTQPRITGEARPGDWRRSLFDQEMTSDLSHLRGLAQGRNVIMVSLESTAAQYLGLYGAAPDPSPNLSALAKDAVIFEGAYAVYPESIKGLYSVLCSGSPAFDTTAEQYERVPCKPVAASLREAGYRTALFHSGRFSYLGMQSVIQHRGFDVLEDAGAIGGNRDSSFGVDEPATVDRVLSWIDAAPRGQPFFLAYLPIAGHHPYEAPDGGPFSSNDDLGRYRNALHTGDVSLGTLVEGIRLRGLDQNTVWIIFGDHGEAFGQHEGDYGHTFHLFEENVHVPFVIAAPGLLHGQTRVPNVVSLLDTAPTILDLVGLETPTDDQGRSMLHGTPQMALFFADYSVGRVGLRDGRWKFIDELGSSRWRLFDLQADPQEHLDRAADQPERTRWYREHLQAWAATQKNRVVAASSKPARRDAEH